MNIDSLNDYFTAVSAQIKRDAIDGLVKEAVADFQEKLRAKLLANAVQAIAIVAKRDPNSAINISITINN